MISGCVQLFLVALLWPMNKLFNKAIKMQKLQVVYHESKLAKWSVRIFLISYVSRSIVCILHAVWAAI